MDDHYLVGFEALMRWRPRGGSDVHPSEFIPLAEDTGSMIALDRYVAQTACRQISEWQRARGDLRLLINASALHFEHADTLREFVSVVQRCDLRPQTLDLELSESAVMGLNPEAVETVRELRGQGIRLHLDDFGTGRSSVTYLQQLNVAALKIDKRFIADMLHDDRAMQIVNAIVTLAASLRVDVIAEGVETEEQARALVNLGVNMGQGYLYAPPMPATEAQRLL
jgi:EAL domain-containing protein (putative c-di-GMP-specific phosphodiesterase class I)